MHLLGVRRYKKWNSDGSWSHKVDHRKGEWRASEQREERLHLNDKMRIRMAKMVIKYFEGKVEREGGDIAQY